MKNSPKSTRTSKDLVYQTYGKIRKSAMEYQYSMDLLHKKYNSYTLKQQTPLI